jgi:hypothetical protein
MSPGNLSGRSFKVEDTDDIDLPGFQSVFLLFLKFPAPGNLLNKISQAVQSFETPVKMESDSSFSMTPIITPDFSMRSSDSPLGGELPQPLLLESDLKTDKVHVQKRLFPESASPDRRDKPLASPLQYITSDPWLGFKFDNREIANCFVFN